MPPDAPTVRGGAPYEQSLEVLLVDRFQHHDDRPLEHFILEGGGIPSGRVSVADPALGICTRRTGGALATPDLARSSSD